MAQATTSSFGDFQVLLGDGSSPEAFSLICGITQKGISFDSDTTDTPVPSCENEDAVPYKEPDVSAQQVSLSGSGVWAAQSHGILYEWWRSGAKRNIKVNYNKVLTGDLKTLSGPAILKSFQHTANRGEKLQLGNLAIVFAELPDETNAT